MPSLQRWFRRRGRKPLPEQAPLGPISEAQLGMLLERFGQSDEPPYRYCADLDDESWFWLNTQGYRDHEEVRAVLPSLPDPDFQARFVGSSGDAALTEGFRAYGLFKELYEQHVGPLADCPSVLDFGCGWGRIIRFFLKDLSPDRLVGVDQQPEVLDACRTTNRWCQFDLGRPFPPLPHADDTFGLAYAYSVFSHLSEEAHLQWVAELARVLRPGALLVATTWHRGFIEANESLRERVRTGTSVEELSAWEKQRLITFEDVEHWLGVYDNGGFCYQPYENSARHESEGVNFYGEACVPRDYAVEHWSAHFDVVDFIDDRARCPQNVIVAQRRR